MPTTSTTDLPASDTNAGSREDNRSRAELKGRSEGRALPDAFDDDDIEEVRAEPDPEDLSEEDA